jgi:hypothetical protein
MFIYESSVNAKTKKLGGKAGNGECKELYIFFEMTFLLEQILRNNRFIT